MKRYVLISLIFSVLAFVAVEAAAGNKLYLPQNVLLEGAPKVRNKLIVPKGTWATDLSSGSRDYESTVSNGLKVVKWEFAEQQSGPWTELAGQTGTKVTWTYHSDMTTVYLRPSLVWLRYSRSYDLNGGSGDKPDDETDVLYNEKRALPDCSADKTGYSFSGWSAKKSGGTVWTTGTAVDGNDLGVTSDGQKATLYAQWSPNEYTVTFDANATGGSCSPAQMTVVYDSKYGELPTPTRSPKSDRTSEESWRFDGWYTEKEAGNRVTKDSTVTITENTTLHAHWTEKFKVVFQDATQFDSAVLKTEYVPSGDEATPPDTPSHAGWTLTGWTGWGESSFVNVKQDRIYTAAYSESTYIIQFNSCNGKGETREEQYSCVTSKPLIANPFSNPGYTFRGWDTQPSATTVVYQDGESVIGLASAGTFYLYAVWMPNSYTIAFDGNGAKSGSMDPMTPVLFGTSTNLPSNKFVYDGLEFKGWYDDLNKKTYADGATVSNLTTEDGGTVTLKATWTEGYFVEFNGNGATAGSMPRQSFERDKDVVLPANAFAKKGYTFRHWTNSLESASKTYVDGATVRNLAAQGQTATLFAVWQPNTYYVRFDDNGADSGTMDVQAFTYDQEQELSKNGYKRNLYTFDGWSDDPEGPKDPDYDVPVKNLTDMPNATNVLYAIWKPTLSDLSQAADCDNLEILPGNESVLGTGNWTVNTTRSFSGESSCWSGIGNNRAMHATIPSQGTLTYRVFVSSTIGTGQFVLKIAEVPISDHVVSDSGGQWIEKSINLNGGEQVIWQWNDTAELDGEQPIDSAWVDSVTWMPDGYTLRFNANGGADAPAEVKIALGSGGKIPRKVPTREGYTFRGWKTDGDATLYQPRDDFKRASAKKDDVVDFLAIWEKSDDPPTPPEPPVDPVVTISSAAVADGKFSLSFKSDAKFDYNLLTNANLLIDGWGIMETQVGDGNILTFEPLIIEGQPQLFYKVETIQRK